MTTRTALLRASLLALAAALLCSAGLARPKTKAERDKESEARMRKDLFYLADPKSEGRGPNTKGLDRAAEYIADQFKQIGLKPGYKGSYFQPFAIRGAVGKLALAGPRGQAIELKPGEHFRPLGSNQKGKLDAPAVFVGYGLKTTEPAYDDYEGVNVKGKVVVLLTGAPRKGADKRPAAFTSARIAGKIAEAVRQGAAGVLMVNDSPALTGEDRLVDTSYVPVGGGKRPLGMFVKRDLVERMLPAGVTLESIEKGINRDLKPNSFELPGWTVRMEAEDRPDGTPLKNVIGVLEGNGPLANETVVVGAHYDHVGYGANGSRTGVEARLIHHGADDNGSGTTGVIELARRFAAMPERKGRRIVFVLFSGEELGLLGSRYYSNNPVFPIEQTAAMLNLDMIGRTQPDAKTKKARLLTQGHGTAKPFKELIENMAKKYDFTLASQESGFGPSDHSSFTQKKVPVLFFWTGTHPDYHTPTDTAEKIDYRGMRVIVDMSEEVLTTFTTMARPSFIEVKGGRRPTRPSTGPRLGLRPNTQSTDGVEVEDVPEGSVAEKAGIKKGDKIIKIAGKETPTLVEYTDALSQQKVGTTIDIVVRRDKKEVKLKAKLE